MVLPPFIIDLIIIWGYAERFVGFCLAVGLVYLIYRFTYKASKQTPPALDNDENPKD